MQTKKYVHEVREVRDFLIANSLRYEHNEVFKALVDVYKEQFSTELKTRKKEKKQMKLICELSKLVAALRQRVIKENIIKKEKNDYIFVKSSENFEIHIKAKPRYRDE